MTFNQYAKVSLRQIPNLYSLLLCFIYSRTNLYFKKYPTKLASSCRYFGGGAAYLTKNKAYSCRKYTFQTRFI